MLWDYLKNKMLKFPAKRLCEDKASLTYEETVIFAEKFAEKLESPYYVIFCHSEMAAALAILSCFAAGVTAVPLSYRYGEAHYKKLFETIKPERVISDIGGELQIINISSQGSFLKLNNSSDRPALVMFTSGTTGKPKGVQISEENLLINLKDIKTYFKINENDKILIERPLYHCAVLTGEFLISLICGLDIVFFSDKFDPNAILRLIGAHKITVMGGTPTLYHILSIFMKNRCHPEPCHSERSEGSSLRKIMLSGEVLNKNCALKIREAFPNTQIYHVYGLTEASPRVAYLPPEYFDEYAEYVGIPLPSVTVKIIDDKGSDVPNGTDGELCIKGGNVTVSGWLHTGDIASIDSTGFIKIKCRKDDMIIRAGMNIYPQEIESTLKTDDRVTEALAYGIPDEMCGQKIGLKVKGKFESTNEVVKLCHEMLPAYSQPSRVELTDEFEKNGSGKLCRKHI